MNAPGARFGAPLGFGTASLSAMPAMFRSGTEPFLFTTPAESVWMQTHAICSACQSGSKNVS